MAVQCLFKIKAVFLQSSSKLSLLRPLSNINAPDMNPPIPSYVERTGESITQKKARLLYQSRKRGMLENGLLLSTFAAKYLESMSESDLKVYDQLINQPSNDWDIYHWIIGAKPTPEEFDSKILNQLKEHASNKSKDSRLSQPDLYS